MEYREYEELKSMLCEKLQEIKKRNQLGMGEIEVIDKLTHSLKSLKAIMENEGGSSYAAYRNYSHNGNYSNTGNSYGNNGRMWSAEGSYADSYGDDNSYARSGMHYVRGHYSRAEDENAMMEQRIEEMIQQGGLSSGDKDTLRRALSIVRK